MEVPLFIFAYFVVGAFFLSIALVILDLDEEQAAYSIAALLVAYLWPIYVVYLGITGVRQSRKRR